MRKLDLSCATNWDNFQPSSVCCPQGLDTICLYCNRNVHLMLQHMYFDKIRNSIISSVRCPACRENSTLWIMNPEQFSNKAKTKCKEMYIYPCPVLVRELVLPSGSIGEHALERAYSSAINAYNAGLWDSCATSCRKTLEGIVHVLNPNGKGTLYERLDKLFSEVNLSEPLLHVSESIRKGGNIASHFDLEKETDKEVATLMLDLLDYFLQYTFLLKEKAKELEKRLDELGRKESADSNSP